MSFEKMTTEEFFDLLPPREVFKRHVIQSEFRADVYIGEFGNFTSILIDAQKGLFGGVAKRNPGDCPGDAGICIAAVRAFRDFCGVDPGYSRQHPISNRKARKIAIQVALNEVFDELALAEELGG